MFASGYSHLRAPSCESIRTIAFCFLAVALTCRESAAETVAVADADAVRAAIARSVPYIERKGAEWIASKDCLSCHHTSFMVWSLGAAKRAGVAVDEDKLRESTAWATEWRNLVAGPNREKAVREETLRGQFDTLAQLLLGQSAANPHRSSTRATPPLLARPLALPSRRSAAGLAPSSRAR